MMTRSASERLRELGPPFDLTETHSWIEVEGVMREINSMVVLYDSLPLIADCIEMAEAVVNNNAYPDQLAVKLAALQGALDGSS